MAVNVTGSMKLLASVTDIRTLVTGAAKEQGSRSVSLDAGWDILSGTAVGLADKMWGDTRTVLTAATDIIDLAALLTDSFGAVVTFVKVRGLAVKAAPTNTTTLQITRPATLGVLLFGAASGNLFPLSAGGFFCWVDPGAGFTVGAGASDILHIINTAGASASYDIAIVGTSA